MKNNKPGRPPKFSSIKKLQKKINEYFETLKPRLLLDKDGNPVKNMLGNPVYIIDPPSLTGLALFLGFESRQSIYDYEKKNNEFSYTIKRARLKCENYIEMELIKGNIPSGPGIFMLKNYGWKDKQELEIQTHKFKIDLIDDDE